MGFLYLDKYYFILCLPAFLFALICQQRVKSIYAKYSQIKNKRGITGCQAAENILRYYGINDVRVVMISGKLSDNFNPKTKTISLSPEVYSGMSVASVGIACHEAGHAAQYSESYAPIRLRAAIIPVTRFGSFGGILLTILGLILNFEPLISIGLILYFFIVIFQFLTLPVEFNASSRALKVIEETGMLYQDEKPMARKVLSSAAMTYVAALAVALAQFLRFFLRVNNRRR